MFYTIVLWPKMQTLAWFWLCCYMFMAKYLNCMCVGMFVLVCPITTPSVLKEKAVRWVDTEQMVRLSRCESNCLSIACTHTVCYLVLVYCYTKWFFSVKVLSISVTFTVGLLQSSSAASKSSAVNDWWSTIECSAFNFLLLLNW